MTTLFTFVTNSSAPASESTSARSSRSSTLGSGLSSRSTESDGEIEALDNVRVVARLVNCVRMFTFR